MQVTINDISYEIPFDLNTITLGDFVAYSNKYGQALDEQLKELSKKEYEGTDDDIELYKTLDLDSHLDNEALAWFSFWTKHDLFEVRDQPFIAPVLEQYKVLRRLLVEQESNLIQLPVEHTFNEEVWTIQDFAINPSSDMSFNEIVTSKEVTRQLYKMGQGKWQALPYLCAIFFRKKGERFTDDLVSENGERLQVLQQLPLSHAMQVAFFLSICVNIWNNTLAFSTEREQEILSRSLQPTMKNGDGSTSLHPSQKQKYSMYQVRRKIASSVRRMQKHTKS